MLRRALFFVAALLSAATGPTACNDARVDAVRDVLVRVDSVALDPNDFPVVVLEEADGSRWLPIWIGASEARSIVNEMAAHRSSRPNTHDLAESVIQSLDGEVAHVVVTQLVDTTYYATLVLRVRDRVIEIDSRPSDAIAIALRAHAPIYVRENLFDESEAARRNQAVPLRRRDRREI
jgi:uncharacterized protein